MRRLFALILLIVLSVPAWAGQEDTQPKELFTIHAQSLFYGDDTEFTDVLREGDTTAGVYNKLFISAPLSPKVRLDVGAAVRYTNGDEGGFDLAKPIFRVRIGSPESQFIMGTLVTGLREGEIGPDLATPHGLIPALQVETMTFTRPYESGIQWLINKPGLRNDAWINWQRLNKPWQRERFDAGVVGQKGSGLIKEVWQAHVAHEGGQVYNPGPVRDSAAYAFGLLAEKETSIGRVSAEGLFALSSYTPDRADEDTKLRGEGFFIRGAIEKSNWRWHVISWRAWDFVKDEGDVNYQSLVGDEHDPASIQYFGRSVDYEETGLTRSWPAGPMRFEASIRFHLIQSNFSYSYRILSNIDLKKVVFKK